MIRFHSSSSSRSHFKVELSLRTGCSSSTGLLVRRGGANSCKPCTINAKNSAQWPTKVPLITSGRDVRLPNGAGTLSFNNMEKVTARCVKSKLQVFGAYEAELQCNNGKFDVTVKAPATTKVTKGKAFKDISCKVLQKPVFWVDATSKKLHIGWVQDEITQMIITYNDARKLPDYVEHTIVGKSIFWNEDSPGRPEFKKANFLGIDQVMPDSYKKTSQQQELEKIHLGLGRQYIDCCNVNYLVRGHLAPNADFSLRSWREATFYMVNVAPQWQGINAGNWFILEDAARNYAGTRGKNIKVFTGTYGKLTLEKDGKDHQINFPEPGTPVPSHFWKVVFDEHLHAAVAFVILNNPYAVPDANGLPSGKDKLCTNQCDYLKTVTTQTPSKGLLMCCSHADLKTSVAFLPGIPATATQLFTSTNLQAVAFGDRLSARLT